MKRLKLIGSWKRLGVQAGLLTGLGLAFVGGAEQPAQALDPKDCPSEGGCTFLKPNLLLIVDYSSSMNEKFGMDVKTRWKAAQEALIELLNTDNEYFDKNVNFALMRFGHDPSANPGSTIGCDISNPKITDGQAVDHWWYDVNSDDKSFTPCYGDTIEATINAIPPPCGGMVTGIGTWTKGAMDQAKARIALSKADHPGENRWYGVLVLTDGKWTSQNGTQTLTAATLFNDDKVPTYVVYFGDQGDVAAQTAADKLASSGGTGQAIFPNNPQDLINALTTVLNSIKDQVIIPQCSPGLPRFMVLVDASSSMLNINNGTVYGKEGETGWDKAREALTGANSIFDVKVNMDKNDAEDLLHLGLAVFGHNTPAPGEQKILVDYGPCHKDNFAWALDPKTSCVAPGCTNPWGGPMITWTFQSSPPVVPPGKVVPFDDATSSHMPKCNTGGGNICVGSGTYTHLGLQRIKENRIAYHAAATMNNAPFPANAMTNYSQILVTDGRYDGYSTDAQVQAEMAALYNNTGVVPALDANNKSVTYVIGFGDGLDDPASITQLSKMACWGSGGTWTNNKCMGGMNIKYFDANNQQELEAAFKAIIEAQAFDPCCQFNDCSVEGEPGGQCPDSQCSPQEQNCGVGKECVADPNQDPACDDRYICVEDLTFCGNGKIDAGEDCDGADLNGQDCQSVGFESGTLACNDTCKFDASGCVAVMPDECGDGVAGASEACDGADLKGASCQSLGYDSGTLGCAPDCTLLDESGCMGGGTSDTTTTTGGGETETGGSATDTAGTGTTGGGSATAGSATATAGSTGDSEGTSDGATDTGGADDDEGCGCTVDESTEGKARGLLGTILGLGLVGFVRRRRRAA